MTCLLQEEMLYYVKTDEAYLFLFFCANNQKENLINSKRQNGEMLDLKVVSWSRFSEDNI